MSRSGRLPKAAALATMASFLFALQHPLAKPLSELWSPAAFAAAAAGMGLAFLPFYMLRQKWRREISRVLADRINRRRLYALAALSCVSAACYAWGIKHAHPATVAVALNTAPFWSAVWSRVVSRQGLPKAFWACAIVGICGAVIASSGSQILATPAGLEVAVFLVLLAVPAVYMLIIHCTQRWLGRMSPTAQVGVRQLIAFPTVLAVFSAFMFVTAQGEPPIPTASQIAGFAAGTIAGQTLATIILQAAYKQVKGSAFPSIFMLLVPVFSLAIGYAFSQLDPAFDGVAPQFYHWVGATILFTAAGVFLWINWPSDSHMRTGQRRTSL